MLVTLVIVVFTICLRSRLHPFSVSEEVACILRPLRCPDGLFDSLVMGTTLLTILSWMYLYAHAHGPHHHHPRMDREAFSCAQAVLFREPVVSGSALSQHRPRRHTGRASSGETALVTYSDCACPAGLLRP